MRGVSVVVLIGLWAGTAAGQASDGSAGELQQLRAENAQLRAENARLKSEVRRLAAGAPAQPTTRRAPVAQATPPKITAGMPRRTVEALIGRRPDRTTNKPGDVAECVWETKDYPTRTTHPEIPIQDQAIPEKEVTGAVAITFKAGRVVSAVGSGSESDNVLIYGTPDDRDPIAKATREHRVVKGMTKAQAVAAMGEAPYQKVENSDDLSHWTWGVGNPNVVGYKQVDVLFKNDVATDVTTSE